jgi:hypothetical protein
MYEDELCPRCGGNLAETTAPENEDRYVAELPLTCHRCVGFARDHEKYEHEPRPQTLIHRVSPHPKRKG